MELFLHLLGSSEPPLQSSSEESPSNYMLSASSLLMLLLPFSSSELSLEYIPISPSSSLGVLLKKVTSSEVNVMSFRCSILNSRFASTCRRCYHFVERYQFQPYSQKVRSCCKQLGQIFSCWRHDHCWLVTMDHHRSHCFGYFDDCLWNFQTFRVTFLP